MDVTYRRARADDAPFVPPLIYSSGPAAFDFVFSHPTRGGAHEFLEFAFEITKLFMQGLEYFS